LCGSIGGAGIISMNFNRALFAGIFIATLAVDIITKRLVQLNLALYDSINIIPGFFNITYILNPGAAFGTLRNLPEQHRKILFVIVSVIACIIILSLLIRESAYRVRGIGYVLILAGAAGNLVDRVRINKVIDFLDFYIGNWHWYVFNIADSAVTVGVALLILEIVLAKRKRKS
jgi:signal peptidase II